jgi:signal transduction histidine kinase
MPEIDGFEVLRRLRSTPVTASIPFIFLTARTDRMDQRHGMELGADDYLTKPFKADELIAAVHIRLEKRRDIAVQYEESLATLRKNIIYALPHELRTPLAIILGNGELLQMDSQSLDGDTIAQMANSIVKSGYRLQRVLENYLVYAQLELLATDPNHTQSLRQARTDHASEHIEAEAILLARRHSRRSDLRLYVSEADISVSEADLRKVIYELLDNAFKFSTNGTVVGLHAEVVGNDYVITVSDEGYGMTPEQIASVGAYMQFERAMHEQQGLGLGLAIVNKMVELYGGAVRIDSKPQRGTEVEVRLPVCQQTESAYDSRQ